MKPTTTRIRPIALFAIMLTTALSVVGQDDTPEVDHSKSKDLKNEFEYAENTVNAGHKIYLRNCVTCHAKDGSGKTDLTESLAVKPNDFMTGVFKYGNTDGEIFSVIKHGTKNGMVAYGEKLKEPQIWHVVNYIRSLGPMEEGKPKIVVEDEVPENPITADYASIGRGKQFYMRFCITCHGQDGKGDTEMREFLDTAPSDLTDDYWLYGDRDGDIFRIIKEGTENEMEAFADRLEDERIWHVVNYVRTLADE